MSNGPDSVRLAFQAVRARLLRARPYLGPALFRMRGPIETNMPAPTMAVDDEWRIYVDPRVLDQWNVEELTGVVAHEVWHLVLGHPHRAKERGVASAFERRAWNWAVDAVVNNMLREEHVRLPDGVIYPETLGLPPGLTANEYYERLLERRQQQQQQGEGEGEGERPGESGGSCGDGHRRAWELPSGASATDDGSDPGAPGPGEVGQIAREVARKVVEHARRAGTGEGAMARWAARQLLPPSVPWQRVLAGAIRAALAEAAGMVDYSYRRPSRRQSAASVVLPRLRRPTPRVAVVVDTSGSMGLVDLDAAMAEVSGVLRAAGSQEIHLFSCDSAASKAQRLFRAQAARLVGGGGTDMGVGLDAAAALRPRPDVTVVLTDGETPWPGTAPRCGRVIVCLVAKTTTAPPAWARVVKVQR